MPTRRLWWTRANGLTFLRLLAAPALVLAIRADAAWLATAVFGLAVATDFADGVVARRFAEQSGLGRLIDHATDAIFVTAGTAALACEGVLPAPLPTLIAASFLQYALDARSSISKGPRPSSLGRWNGIAYFAIIAVPIVRDALGTRWPGPAWVITLGWLLVGSTVVSIASRLWTGRFGSTTRERVRGWRGAGRADQSRR
jgi:phosphatidylglycerophosphate synthase